jgi:hypothetical protein
MITSSKGKQMFQAVSPIYYQSIIMQSIFQVIGTEWEDIDEIVGEILLQLFPQTATWGLRYWEELLNIPANESIPIEKRRSLVMTRIKLRAPMTPARISSAVKSLAGQIADFVEVVENVEPHVFRVVVGAKESGIDYLGIYREIKRIKPSHESFYLGNSYLRSFNLSKRDMYGFSKIIHAIGTFVCSKDDVECTATKGYRGIGDIPIEEKRIYGTSDPLVCSEKLIHTTEGFLDKNIMDQQVSSSTGTSNPLICSKNLKYTRIEVV